MTELHIVINMLSVGKCGESLLSELQTSILDFVTFPSSILHLEKSLLLLLKPSKWPHKRLRGPSLLLRKQSKTRRVLLFELRYITAAFQSTIHTYIYTCMYVSLSMMMFIAIIFKKLGPIGPNSGFHAIQ